MHVSFINKDRSERYISNIFFNFLQVNHTNLFCIASEKVESFYVILFCLQTMQNSVYAQNRTKDFQYTLVITMSTSTALACIAQKIYIQTDNK